MPEGVPYYLADPSPAPTVPGLKELAGSLTGANIAEKVVGMAPKPPTSEDLRGAAQRSEEAREAMRRRQTSYDEATKPQIEEYRAASQKYADDAKRKIPQPQQPSPQPPQGLEPFLATRENEPPAATIGKLVQAISLFATMAGGGRSGARASLSAMTGALEGWREGNRYKADKAYTAWKDSTEAMFRGFDDEMRAYNSLMIADRVPLEQKFRAMELSAYEHKNAMLAAEFQVAEADKVTQALEKRQDAYQKVLQWYSDTVARKEEADLRHQERLDKQQKDFDQHIELLKTRQAVAKQSHQLAYTEDTLNRLAKERAGGAALPDLVRGIGGQATNAGIEIDNRATAIQQQRGVDPAQAMLMARASQRANRMTLTDLSKKEAQWGAFARAFEPTVERVLQLAKKVDERTGMPVMDKWILRTRAEYAGDPDVAALKLGFETLAQEFSRVVTRSGQTTEATRAEARDNFSLARTPEQIQRMITEVLRPEVEFARQGFEREKASLLAAIATPPQPGQAPPGQKAPPGGRAPSRADVESAKQAAGGDVGKALDLLRARGFDTKADITQ